MYRSAADSHPQTTAATGRRLSRPAGKSCVNVRMDEWLFDWVKQEATKSKRSLSQQMEMMAMKYAEGRIK